MLTHEERLKIYDEATKLWGLVAQYDQCVEEMAEMIVAINKYKRKVLYKEYQNDDKVIKNLVEEIADVSICLEQMKHFFNAHFLQFVTKKLYEIVTVFFQNFFEISKMFLFFRFLYGLFLGQTV